MTIYGILLGLVGMGLTTVVVYHYVDIALVAAGLAEKLQPFIIHTLVVTTRATQGLRQRVTGVTLVCLEHVCRGLEQVPSEVTLAIRYLGSVAWMDHVHTTNAALQQAYAMGTAALAGIQHAVSVLDSTIRAIAPSEIAPYLTFSIVLLVLWLVRRLLLVVIQILWLLIYLIGVGLHGSGMLALVYTLYRAVIWLLVCTLQALELSANVLNALIQFLVRSLAVSPSPTAIKPTKCKD